MNKRLLILTQLFDPEPTFKGILFAKELKNMGYSVEVLTGFPNYPGGKIYPGFKLKLFDQQIIRGIKVTRVPLYPSHSKSKVGRVLNYLSFFISSMIYGVFFAKRPDIIYVYHPPLTAALSGLIIKKLRRSPLVLDIQDLWPDTLHATNMISNKTIIKIIDKFCNLIYRNTDHIVVLSNGFKNCLIQRQVPSKKIDVIHNWADEKSLRSYKSDNYFEKFSESFNVLFAGNIGKAQGLDVILDAAKICKNKEVKVNFFIIGDGLVLADLKKRKLKENIDNLFFLSSVPMNEIGRILYSADALLVHLKKDPLFKITIPSKIQAYMSVGKPIICGIDGDANNLIKDADCGVVFEPENSTELFNRVNNLANMNPVRLVEMGKNGAFFYDKKLSVKAGVQHFTEIFKRLMN